MGENAYIDVVVWCGLELKGQTECDDMRMRQIHVGIIDGVNVLQM